MIFLYRPYPAAKTSGRVSVLFRPEIPIRVHGVSGSKLVRALVDTGSGDTLLPLSVARNIGAKVDQSHRWQVAGLGAQPVDAISGEIAFELVTPAERFRWPATVGLVDFPDPADEFTILGHANFLEFFLATFDGNLHALELIPAASYSGTVS